MILQITRSEVICKCFRASHAFVKENYQFQFITLSLAFPSNSYWLT